MWATGTTPHYSHAGELHRHVSSQALPTPSESNPWAWGFQKNQDFSLLQVGIMHIQVQEAVLPALFLCLKGQSWDGRAIQWPGHQSPWQENTRELWQNMTGDERR